MRGRGGEGGVCAFDMCSHTLSITHTHKGFLALTLNAHKLPPKKIYFPSKLFYTQ